MRRPWPRRPDRPRSSAARRSVGGTVWTVLALSLAAVGSTAVSALAAPTGVAGADPISDCSTTTGVIVVVDFAQSVYPGWPGTIERGCDGPLTTGAYALTRAGFTPPEGAPIGVADESGFVCRLVDPANDQEYPTAAEQDCLETPPANAYWSFWYAQAGDTSWNYSNQGAAGFEPTAGSVDAWVFGGESAGGQPPIPSPASLRATNPGPPPTVPPTVPPTAPPPTSPPPTPVTAAGSATPGVGAGATSGTTPPGRTGAGHSAPATVPGGSTTSPDGTTSKPGSAAKTNQSPSDGTGTGTGTGGHPSSGPRILNVTPSSAVAKPSAGSPLPFVLGAVVVAALAGSAGLVARRRRRAD
jgi:hypothetical protein